ncbi:TadE family protein [Nocardioides caldifontis]|uniref:TadE family protein n=1 Tax=Nocardioides caldifontis TaxID=2588938 RepID=UPI0011DFD1CF|nr:TadE family protein [Nocardioides caldifontis]
MSQRARTERGQATIEILGIIPIAALILGGIIQLFLVGYAAVSAESASRLAAREYSKGASAGAAEAAARAEIGSLFEPVVEVAPGNLSDDSEEPAVGDGTGLDDPVSARVSVKVPFLGIGVENLNIRVTRYTVMPRTED